MDWSQREDGSVAGWLEVGWSVVFGWSVSISECGMVSILKCGGCCGMWMGECCVRL